MTTTANDLDRLMEAIGGESSWNTIDELVQACDSAGFWDDDFAEHAASIAKKQVIRRLIKQAKDGTGFPVFASVVTTDENGNEVRRYKQETLFDPDDYRQVAAYHAGRRDYHAAMVSGYSRRCEERYGVQLFFDWGSDGDDASAPVPR